MWSKNKKVEIDPKILTAQNFINITKIENSMLHSNDGYIFSFIWVKSKDINLLDAAEKQRYFLNLSVALEEEKEPWQLISLPRTIDIGSIVDHLYSLRKGCNEDAKLNLITNEIEAVKTMSDEGLKEPLIFIKLWQKVGKTAESDLMRRTNEITSKLQDCKVFAEIFDDKDISYICKIYAELGRHHDEDDLPPIIPAVPELNKKGMAVPTISANLSNLTPVGGITFKNNRLIIGGTSGRVYAANKFTADLNYDWLVRIMNCTEAITCITFSLNKMHELGDALSRAVAGNIKDANTTTDARSQMQAMKRAEDSTALLDMLDAKGASIGMASFLVMPFSEDEDKLDDVYRRVNVLYASNRIKLRALGQLQQEGFKSITPYYTPDDRILDISNRIMPLLTYLGGSPMSVNVYKDDNGLYFGRSVDGSVISLDLWKRSQDRTNTNFVITGKPGTGKSTSVKHIIQNMYMLGVKILIIDPESEYKDMCKNLGGSWIDCGGGNAKINILEIKDVPTDDDEDDDLYKSGESSLANHMRTLEIFFNTYIPSMSEMQMAALKRSLIKLYKQHGIEWDTDVSNIKHTDFPTFENLYKLITDEAIFDDTYKSVAALLHDICEGADSFLWNGHTNIDTSNNVVVFDTHRLNNAGDNVKRGQYFNIMTLAWDIMSRNRDEKVALFADEAYLMIDPNIPQTMMYMRNISKRCRKYSASFGVISHSLVDFLDDRIRAYGQSLLENPTYKIFFGTDGQNLKETTELYNLSESEQGVLMAGVQREALTFIGSQRVRIRFTLPKYKIDLMGKGGGA